jgi:hypothetical protein
VFRTARRLAQRGVTVPAIGLVYATTLRSINRRWRLGAALTTGPHRRLPWRRRLAMDADHFDALSRARSTCPLKAAARLAGLWPIAGATAGTSSAICSAQRAPGEGRRRHRVDYGVGAPVICSLSGGAGGPLPVSRSAVGAAGAAAPVPAPPPPRSRIRTDGRHTGCWTKGRGFSGDRTADSADWP